MLGRVERGGHVLLSARRGSSEAAGFPARSEMLRGRVGGDIHVDVGVTSDDHRVPPAEAACRGIHLYVGPERRPSRARGATCLRPVDVDEGEASPVRADLQGRGFPGDNFREAEHLVLRHVLAADRGEEAPPSRGGGGPRLRQPAPEVGGVPLVPERRGHVHLLRPGGDPRFLEHDGKAPSWGSMPVMRCSLSVQAAGPLRRRSVSRRDRSGGTRPLRRFHERSHRASPVVSSWSQLSRAGIVKVLPWVVEGAGGLGAGKTSGAGTRGVSLDVVIGGITGDTDTNGGESSDNRSKVHADCGPAENPSL